MDQQAHPHGVETLRDVDDPDLQVSDPALALLQQLERDSGSRWAAEIPSATRPGHSGVRDDEIRLNHPPTEAEGWFGTPAEEG